MNAAYLPIRHNGLLLVPFAQVAHDLGFHNADDQAALRRDLELRYSLEVIDVQPFGPLVHVFSLKRVFRELDADRADFAQYLKAVVRNGALIVSPEKLADDLGLQTAAEREALRRSLPKWLAMLKRAATNPRASA